MNIRLQKLIRLLIENEGICKQNDLADKLGISSRTLRKDFEYCSDYLKSFGIVICKKPGVGMWIEAEEESKLLVLDALQNEKSVMKNIGVKGRKISILKHLLFSERIITFHYLLSFLHVSQVTLYKDIIEVTNWLKQRNVNMLKSIQGGYVLGGNEADIRTAMSDWRLLCIESGNYIDQTAMLYDTLEISKIYIDYAKSIICTLEVSMQLKISPDDYANLVFKLILSIYRIKKGNVIGILEKRGEYKRQQFEKYADIIKELVERYFYIDLTEDELVYFYCIIESVNEIDCFTDETSDDRKNNQNRKIASKIAEIIMTNIHFPNKAYSRAKIIKKVVSMIKRINYGSYTYYPAADIIYRNSDILKNIVDEIEPYFDNELGYRLTDSDKSEWVNYISLLIEESKIPLNAIYLFSHNFLDAELSLKVLHNNFNLIKVVRLLPYKEYNEELSEDVDLILIDSAMIELKTCKKIILIPPNQTISEKKIIFENISHFYEDLNYKRMTGKI